MAEFSIIERYCQGIGVSHRQTKLSVGDDAAVIEIPAGMELAISVDTMVEGVHFLAGADPGDLAHKLLAVNLSDMAAMGARPKWATMTLTTPKYDKTWLDEFSAALNGMAQDFGVQLIGGDTTQGSLNLSIQIMGLLPSGKSLRRSGALVDDDVYVSNNLGDAALALKLLCADDLPKRMANNDESSANSREDALLTALHRPQPQCDLGLGLLDIANSCIDVSDGLVADLAHIAQHSGVSIEVNVEKVPLSDDYRHYLQPIDFSLALAGGDDYQLAFTASAARRSDVEALSLKLDVPLTNIGRVVKANDKPVNLLINDGPYLLQEKLGYQHFS